MALGIFGQLDWLTKKVKQLCCWLKLIEDQSFRAYGSYYSDIDQVCTVGVALPITVQHVDFEDGVSIVSGSQITLAKAGKYNIQFSLQLHHRGGGGSGKNIDIWLSKNGSNLSNSNTRVDVDTNSPYRVAAWNFFVDAAAGDYFQLKWTTSNASIVLEREAIGLLHPETPSVILTVNQIA